GRSGRVTDVEDVAGREGGVPDPRRDGPRTVRRLRLGAGAEHPADRRSGQQLGPEPGEGAAVEVGASHDTEPDVRPPVGEGEGPDVPGEEVGLEPDVKVTAPGAGLAHVLAERVPLPAVADLVVPEEPAQRR